MNPPNKDRANKRGVGHHSVADGGGPDYETVCPSAPYRFVVAGIPWLVIAPAFWLRWLPVWYIAPLFVAFVVTEHLSEKIGRGAREE